MLRYESHIPDKCFVSTLFPLKSPKDNPKAAKPEKLSGECCTQVRHFTTD